MNDERTILYFDGVCNLCNRTVQFVLRHDKRNIIYFKTLQSSDLPGHIPETVVLWYKGRYYYKSDAVLKLFRIFGGLWSVLAAGYFIPKFIRDALYDFIARRRYKWFGKTDACMVPTQGVAERFLS